MVNLILNLFFYLVDEEIIFKDNLFKINYFNFYCNSNLNIELEEESKYVEELFIPDEIYGREFQLIDMSNQWNNLVKIFENNIQRKNNNVEIWKKVLFYSLFHN